MKKTLLLFSIFSILGCKTQHTKDLIVVRKSTQDSLFTIAFGSCDNQKINNELWPAIDSNNPSVWIWGGDNVYSDTEDMHFLENNYKLLLQHLPEFH